MSQNDLDTTNNPLLSAMLVEIVRINAQITVMNTRIVEGILVMEAPAEYIGDDDDEDDD